MIAVLGPAGTYSSKALSKYLEVTNKKLEIKYFNSISKVGSSGCKYTLLPLENTLDGYVIESIDVLIKHDYNIICDMSLFIEFSFVSNTSIDKIKRLYVQFKTRNQCTIFLDNYDFEIVICESNIEALDKALEDNFSAAIIPTYKVDDYNFKTVINNVTDCFNNYTRFIVLSRDIKNYVSTVIKSSIIIYSKIDKPGLLFSILERFNKYNINLVSIMSRPTKDKMGNYNFFIECLLSQQDVNKINILKDEINNKEDAFMRVLGIYSSID